MPKESETAVHLRRAIRQSGKTLREICGEVGLARPNVLSMMQLGNCNVPIDRIPAIARACGVPADAFIEVAIKEYYPAIWNVLGSAARAKLDHDEREWLSIYDALTRRDKVEVDSRLWLAIYLYTRDMLT